MELYEDQIAWGRIPIKYQYSFSSRKTLAISVHPNLDVTVVAPVGVGLEDIRSKVLKRASWICQSKRDFELYLPKQPERQYISGETHRYLGRQYRLKIRYHQNTNAVKYYRGCLWVSCTDNSFPPAMIKNQLQSWYREKAQKTICQAMKKYVPRVLGNESAIPPFTIRLMKTRWGSCSKSGRIYFNLELLKAPTDCIEYVVVHELCHLKEHNHSAQFWWLVTRALPDFAERKRRLNKFADV